MENREIKFRAQKLATKEWVYGYYVVMDGKHFIIQPDSPCESEFKDDWFEVDPSTVGQYTGLKDNNGNDIYEGMSIKVDNGDYPIETICKFSGGCFTLEDNAGGHWTRQLLNQPERLTIHDKKETA